MGMETDHLSNVFDHMLKVLIRKNNLFQRGDSQDAFEPPHYELFTLRDKVSLIVFKHYKLYVTLLSSNDGFQYL